MKRILLFFVLVSGLALPNFAFAFEAYKDYCSVVSGNGRDVGSEIACGDEYFYVISSNQSGIKMIAKYNLNTGVAIYKGEVAKGLEGNDYYNACLNLALDNGGTIKIDDFYSGDGICFYYKQVDDTVMKQNPEAKSAHWDSDGNYMYPQIGDVYMSEYDIGINVSESPVQSGTSFYDFTVNLNAIDNNNNNSYYSTNEFPRNFQRRLARYKSYLNDNGYNVKDISLLTLTELNRIITNATNTSLPLKDWSDKFIDTNISSYSEYKTYIEFGLMKPYIPSEYSWLYSSTYWNGTIFRNESTYTYRYFVFTNEQGKLCGAGFNNCAPTTQLGCGLRPVITIANELKYQIKTNNNGIGTIEVIDNSLANKSITFKISANKDDVLDKVVVKTEDGRGIVFNKGDLVTNEDGSYTIDGNSFIMPNENVTIEAIWKGTVKGVDENPKTGIQTYEMITIIVLIIAMVSLFIVRKRQNKLFQ